MREIKFRAKAINNDYYKKGTWVYGSLLAFKGFSIFDSLFKNWVDVDGKTKGQYTGLKDKNGVEIYEGDIVDDFGTRCTVIWEQFDCSFQLSCTRYQCSLGEYDTNTLEVIGNIYDNPEFLEK